MAGENALSAYLAEIQHAIAQGRLQLDRDIFEQVTRPMWLDVQRPAGVSALTGTLMDRPDLYGRHAGRATIGTLQDVSQMAGRFADDPRFGEFASQETLQGREATNASLARDTQLELETGRPYLDGAPMPPWMTPHAEWAREFRRQAGRTPTVADLDRTLARYGTTQADFGARTYEDVYGPGAAYYAGNQMARVPGGPTVGATGMAAPEWGLDAAPGRMQYQRAAGVVPSAPADPRVGGGGFPGPALGPFAMRGGLAFQGSGATGASYGGAIKDARQRALEEEGRQADLQAQLRVLDQEIERQRLAQQNAVEQGRLDLAREIERGRLDLENRRFGLDAEIQRGQLALQQGVAVGEVGGRATLAAQELYGGDPSRPTLEREYRYGGAALVPGGLTLEAQRELGVVGGQSTVAREAEENRTALGYLNLVNSQRGPENAFVHARTLAGTPRGILDVVDAAAGRFQLQRYGGGQGAIRAAGGVGAPSMSPVYDAAAALAAPGVRSNQWAPQNVGNLGEYRTKLLLAREEAQGEDPNEVWEQYRRSLPGASGPRLGRFRLAR